VDAAERLAAMPLRASFHRWLMIPARSIRHRVNVTGEFPFLVTKLSPYYDQ